MHTLGQLEEFADIKLYLMPYNFAITHRDVVMRHDEHIEVRGHGLKGYSTANHG